MSDLALEVRTMKAVSLWQPFAQLIAVGAKRHETRHWATDYRGQLAIHASKTLDLAGAPDELCLSALGIGWRDRAPLGAVVAVCDLVDCHHAAALVDRITRADHAAGNFAYGRFAWQLARVRALKAPIPLVGRQRLFNWTPPEDLDDNLGPELDHAAFCHAIGWS